MVASCSKSEAPKPTGSEVASAVDAQDLCAPEAFDTLLTRYASGGRVDYGRLSTDKADLATFDAYLGRIGRCDASKLQGPAHYAFWVNAYNAFNCTSISGALAEAARAGPP